MQHCNVGLLLLTPDHIHSLLQVVIPSVIMVWSSSVNLAKLKELIKTLIRWLDLKVPQAMLLTHFSSNEVANLSLCCFIQQSFPGKVLKDLKAHVLGPLPPPPPPQPNCTEWFHNHTIDATSLHVEEGLSTAGVGACMHTTAVTPSSLPPQPPPSSSMPTIAVDKQKSWNCAH